MTRTVFHGGKVFDGTMAPLADADVVIEDGKIVEVGPGLDGDEGIDCAGKALLPGLFDTHVHLTGTYEDDELTIQHRPFSYGFYQTPANLLTTIQLGITSVRDAGGADAGLRMAVHDGLLVGPRMQVSITMLSQTAGHNDEVLPSGGVERRLAALPGVPQRRLRRRRRRASEGPRGGPCRRRRDQDRVLRRVLLARRRSDAPALRPGRARHDRAHGRRPRPLGDVARARARRHQARGARGRAFDRTRHLPRSGVRRADGGARHLARADPHRRRHDRGAGQRREARPRDPREVQGSGPSGVRRDASCGRGRREGRAWAPTPRSCRTAGTSTSWRTWRTTGSRRSRRCTRPPCRPPS